MRYSIQNHNGSKVKESQNQKSKKVKCLPSRRTLALYQGEARDPAGLGNTPQAAPQAVRYPPGYTRRQAGSWVTSWKLELGSWKLELQAGS